MIWLDQTFIDDQRELDRRLLAEKLAFRLITDYARVPAQLPPGAGEALGRLLARLVKLGRGGDSPLPHHHSDTCPPGVPRPIWVRGST
jgi:hypothetical protein